MTTPIHRANTQSPWLRIIRIGILIAIIAVAFYNLREPPAPPVVNPEAEVAEVARPEEQVPRINVPVLKTEPPSDPLEPESRPSSPPTKTPTLTTPKSSAPTSIQRAIIKNQTIRDQQGEVVFQGDIDLSDTLARIDRGDKLSQFSHDGITFENRERKLPRRGVGYYREWVHPTPHVRGPGPQRVISGGQGERWYTPDHYRSFIGLNP